MKKLLTRLGQYYHILFIAMVFSATIFLLYLIVPGESRFRYEFQKNAPWRHETLIAPFNFAIYKPDEAVKNERDSVKKQFIPYYEKDTLLSLQQSKNFELELNTLAKEIPALTEKNVAEFSAIVQQVYEAGIISQSPETHPILKDKSELYIIDNKTVSKVPVSSIYSLKTAFQTFKRYDSLFLKRRLSPAESEYEFSRFHTGKPQLWRGIQPAGNGENWSTRYQRRRVWFRPANELFSKEIL